MQYVDLVQIAGIDLNDLVDVHKLRTRSKAGSTPSNRRHSRDNKSYLKLESETDVTEPAEHILKLSRKSLIERFPLHQQTSPNNTRQIFLYYMYGSTVCAARVVVVKQYKEKFSGIFLL